MYRIYFYKDKRGKSPIKDYLQELSEKGGKDSKIKIKKIYEYVRYLSEVGQQAGAPYMKHLDGNIWELRPIRDRILFAAWNGESFVLLHHFMKQTQKTPQKEIDLAKREFANWKERSKEDE